MRRSILSVNGNKPMSYLLQTILEKEFSFFPATDVFHALQILKSNRSIEALVIDLDFQTKEGWELIEHLKTGKLYNIPVIALKTDNDEDLKHKSFEFEVDEVFIKPFNPLDLIAAIKTLVTVNSLAGE